MRKRWGFGRDKEPEDRFWKEPLEAKKLLQKYLDILPESEPGCAVYARLDYKYLKEVFEERRICQVLEGKPSKKDSIQFMWFLGYAKEGEYIQLQGCNSEAEVDSLIEEFKVTGKILVPDWCSFRYRVLKPDGVFKFKCLKYGYVM